MNINLYSTAAPNVLGTTLALRASAKQAAGSEVNALLAGINGSTSENAKNLIARQSELKNVLQQIQKSKSDEDSQRKEAARQKVERLKAQIRALKLRAMINPQAVVRQAAQLARELANAVKDYSGSGGGGDVFAAGGGATLVAPATDSQASVQAQAEAQQVQAEASSEAREIAQGGSQPTVAEEETTAPNEEIQNAVNEKISDLNAKVGASRADQEFANEARKLLNELKSIVQRAKLSQDSKTAGAKGNDVQEADKALQEAEQGINGIVSGALSTLTSIDIKV